MPHRPRLLASQRGAANIATASAPTVVTGFGARERRDTVQAGQAGLATGPSQKAAALGRNSLGTVRRVFDFFCFRLNSKKSYKLLKYIENVLYLRKVHSKFL
jgi:hypothetical protein